MTLGVACIALVAILVGATLQRLSGTGVGLVVAPVLALLLGPQLGVFLTNTTSVISGALIMLAVIKHVDWRRYAIFAPCAVLGSVPAAFLVAALPAAWLTIVLGAVVLVALGLTFGLPRIPHVTSPVLAGVAGTVGGFLNTTAGVAAPAMVIYAKFARWDQRPFAATMQPTFMTMGLLSVVSKLLFGDIGLAELPPWWALPFMILAVLGGIGLGSKLAGVVSLSAARAVAISLAGLGGLVAVVRGVLMLL